jgi:hypothetical protein
MNPFIEDLLEKINTHNQTTDLVRLFVGYPWLTFDSDGVKSIFIFRRRRSELIVSLGGNVKHGTWEYILNINSLMVLFPERTDLFNIAYLDGNIMVLQKDGTSFKMLFVNYDNIKANSPADVKEKVQRIYLRPKDTSPPHSPSTEEKSQWAKADAPMSWGGILLVLAIVIAILIICFIITEANQ